jgi:hypothetical protein
MTAAGSAGRGVGEGAGVAAGGEAEGLPNSFFSQLAIACSLGPVSQSSVRASVSENVDASSTFFLVFLARNVNSYSRRAFFGVSETNSHMEKYK